jgi:hypothetical protein
MLGSLESLDVRSEQKFQYLSVATLQPVRLAEDS